MATGATQRLNRIGQGDDPAQVPFGLIFLTFNKLVPFSNVGGVVEFASVPLCGLPLGHFIVMGGFLHLDALKNATADLISATFNLSYSLGTAATPDNSIVAANEIDLLTAQTAAAAVAGVAAHQAKAFNGINTVAGAAAVAPGTYANPTGTLACFLNMTLPDADISGLASLRVKGTIRIAYCGLGKNT